MLRDLKALEASKNLPDGVDASKLQSLIRKIEAAKAARQKKVKQEQAARAVNDMLGEIEKCTRGEIKNADECFKTLCKYVGDQERNIEDVKLYVNLQHKGDYKGPVTSEKVAICMADKHDIEVSCIAEFLIRRCGNHIIGYNKAAKTVNELLSGNPVAVQGWKKLKDKVLCIAMQADVSDDKLKDFKSEFRVNVLKFTIGGAFTYVVGRKSSPFETKTEHWYPLPFEFQASPAARARAFQDLCWNQQISMDNSSNQCIDRDAAALSKNGFGTLVRGSGRIDEKKMSEGCKAAILANKAIHHDKCKGYGAIFSGYLEEHMVGGNCGKKSPLDIVQLFDLYCAMLKNLGHNNDKPGQELISKLSNVISGRIEEEHCRRILDAVTQHGNKKEKVAAFADLFRRFDRTVVKAIFKSNRRAFEFLKDFPEQCAKMSTPFGFTANRWEDFDRLANDASNSLY